MTTELGQDRIDDESRRSMTREAEILIEGRLDRLEREVAELKRSAPPQSSDESWVNSMTGSLQDYPEFDEVARLGREARAADRPLD